MSTDVRVNERLHPVPGYSGTPKAQLSTQPPGCQQETKTQHHRVPTPVKGARRAHDDGRVALNFGRARLELAWELSITVA
jgi:hypothetical protein